MVNIYLWGQHNLQLSKQKKCQNWRALQRGFSVVLRNSSDFHWSIDAHRYQNVEVQLHWICQPDHWLGPRTQTQEGEPVYWLMQQIVAFITSQTKQLTNVSMWSNEDELTQRKLRTSSSVVYWCCLTSGSEPRLVNCVACTEHLGQLWSYWDVNILILCYLMCLYVVLKMHAN